MVVLEPVKVMHTRMNLKSYWRHAKRAGPRGFSVLLGMPWASGAILLPCL